MRPDRLRPPRRGLIRPRLAILCAAAILFSWTALPSSAAQDSPGAAAHPPPAPGGAVESPESVKAVTTRILCMCGGCVNQTLHECTCGTAAMERDQVSGEIASGKSPEEIIQGYIDQYGLQVLLTPEKTGFNLLGWLVPFIVAFLGLATLTLVLRGWVRKPHPVPAGAAPNADLPGDPSGRKYREQLEKELSEFEA